MKLSLMRPHDVVVLLKIIALGHNEWRSIDLANQLFISPSEISESLFRNKLAGLIGDSKKNVHKKSLYEFLVYGIKYFSPQRPGEITRGMPTAHSAPPLSELIRSSGTVYVWPDENGTVRGEAIEPLYPTIPKAAKIDRAFYELIALVDAIRVGKSRESQIAVSELRKRILKDEKQ